MPYAPADASAGGALQEAGAGDVAPAPEWSRLAAAVSGNAAIFQSFEWIGAWTEHFLPARTPLRRLACADADALRAQAWAFRYGEDGRDRWLLAGSGNTDTLDPLLEPSCAVEAAESLLEGVRLLAREAPVELLQQTATSPLVQRARRSGHSVRAAEPCLVVDVQAGAGLESSVEPGLARAIAYARRRLGREGTWSIDDATRDTVHERLEQLFALHAARWRGRGERGVLAEEAVRGFHRCVARRLVGRGLVLRALRLNGRTIGCHYGFRTRDREIYYIGGFDPACAKLSPGVLLLADAFERARADGLQWLDLLRGREPYKYAWGAREAPHVNVIVG